MNVIKRSANTPAERAYELAVYGRDKALSQRNELREALILILNQAEHSGRVGIGAINKAKQAIEHCKL